MSDAVIGYDRVVIKPGTIPDFYRCCPVTNRPPLLVQYEGAYTYGWVKGRRATTADALDIMEVCKKYVWTEVGDLSNIAKNAYVSYVQEKLVRYVPRRWWPLVEEAERIILDRVMPKVQQVHGDLTLENVVVDRGNNVVFVDPGLARYAFTPGLDRGKLLQSIVMRWEDRAWTHPGRWPDWADQVDWAFLVTHWVRLMPHWPKLYTKSGFKILRRLRP